MSETHRIEKQGLDILKTRLSETGHDVKNSDNKTFDLIVDGNYVEVKTKYKSADKLDFISLTEKQMNELGRKLKTIYLVCNVTKIEEIEIYKIQAEDLLKQKPREVKSYEWDRTKIIKKEI